MEFPLVTIFTLIYNTNPKYVIEAIESVRNNNYPNIQHIIIDDCSPDTTPKKVVKQWIAENNYPCEFHEHEVNFGLCKTLNHVLELAKGKYLIGCSDDILLKNRIINDVTILEDLDDQYALVHSRTEIIDMNSFKVQRFFYENKIPADYDYFDQLLTSNFISAPSVTMVTETIKKVGGYDESLLFEDYEMWLRLSKLNYKFKYYDKINTYYRVHEESISNSNDIKKNRLMVTETRKIISKIISEKKHKIIFHNSQLIHKHNLLTLNQIFNSFLILLKCRSIKLVHIKVLFKVFLFSFFKSN
jgi:glycosyltransferase involved in cell wall biosynthesis